MNTIREQCAAENPQSGEPNYCPSSGWPCNTCETGRRIAAERAPAESRAALTAMERSRDSWQSMCEEARAEIATLNETAEKRRAERNFMVRDLNEAKAELDLNAAMLARQCDLAMESDTKVVAAQAEISRMRTRLRNIATAIEAAKSYDGWYIPCTIRVDAQAILEQVPA